MRKEVSLGFPHVREKTICIGFVVLSAEFAKAVMLHNAVFKWLIKELDIKD